MPNTFVSDRVPFASSSRLKPDRPVPVVVKAKSWASFGTASLTIVIEPHWTVIVVLLWLLPRTLPGSFVAVTLAVFGSVPQSAASVTPVTWMTSTASAAMTPKLQFRTFDVIEHSPLSSVQLTPAGSGSLRVTPLAVPLPMFLTSIV